MSEEGETREPPIRGVGGPQAGVEVETVVVDDDVSEDDASAGEALDQTEGPRDAALPDLIVGGDGLPERCLAIIPYTGGLRLLVPPRMGPAQVPEPPRVEPSQAPEPSRAEPTQTLEAPRVEPASVDAGPAPTSSEQSGRQFRRPSRFAAADVTMSPAGEESSGEYGSSSDIDSEVWAEVRSKAGEFFHAVLTDFGPELVAELDARGRGGEGGEPGAVSAPQPSAVLSPTPARQRGDWWGSMVSSPVRELWGKEADAWAEHFEAGRGAAQSLAQLQADLEHVARVVTRMLPGTSRVSLLILLLTLV